MSPFVTPPVFAVGVLTVVVGAIVAVVIAPHTWAVDATRNLAAADSLREGTFGTDGGYLYSPLAAALTIPATWLPAGLAIGLWFAARLGVLVAGAWSQARGLGPGDRLLAVVAAVFFVPCVLDLSLGNVSILLAAALAVVAWRRDELWTGAFMGLALATVPKPQLLPVLVWMMLFRPRATVGALVTAGAATVLTMLLFGVDQYLAWFDVLRAPDYVVSGAQQGNLALGTWLEDRLPALAPLAVPLSALAVAGTVVGLVRGAWPGLIASICLGLLVAPYTMAYGAVLLLVAVRPLALAAPRCVVALALAAPFGIILAMPVWVAVVMVVAIGLPRASWAAAPFARPAWPWAQEHGLLRTTPA